MLRNSDQTKSDVYWIRTHRTEDRRVGKNPQLAAVAKLCIPVLNAMSSADCAPTTTGVCV